MRIGVDLRSLQEKEQAGISRYTSLLCESLVKIDKENKYFFYFNTCKDIDYPEFTKQGTIIHNRVPSRLFNFCSHYLGFPILDKKDNLDIFWQPSFNFIRLSKNVSKIITVHDLSWLINPRWYSYKMRLWHRLQGVAKIVTMANKIIAVSKSSAADLKYFFHTPDNKIEVIYSGFSIEKDLENNKLHIGLKNDYLLFVGAIEPRKNVLGIIQTWENIYDKYPDYRKIHFVIMGTSGWSNNEVHKAMKNSKYSDLFHYVGYTSDEERHCYIKHSKGLIWPSFYEGFGHPPLEALGRSKPVITGNGSSLTEIVKNNAILIDPYNIADIEAAIIELIKNPIKVNKDIVNEYSWEKTAEEYIKIFNNFKK